MKTAEAIAEILKREGVEFVFGYPVNPILEAARARRHPADHRAPGAHRAAHGRRDVARDQRPAHRRVRDAARAGHRERLRRRGAGVRRVGADRWCCRAAIRARHRQVPPQLQRRAELPPRHQVGRAADLPAASCRTCMRRAFTQLRNGRPGGRCWSRSRSTCSARSIGEPLDYTPATRAAQRARSRRGARGRAALLVEAERPVIYAGQGVHWAQAWGELRAAGRAAARRR